MNHLDGVEVLAENVIEITPKLLFSAFVVFIFLCVLIGFIIHMAIFLTTKTFTIKPIVISSILGLIVGIIYIIEIWNVRDECKIYEYKVIVSSSIEYKDLEEYYDIVDVDGKILTLRIKNTK